MKRNDILLVIGILLLSVCAWTLYHSLHSGKGSLVQVTVDGTATHTFPLDTDQTYTIRTEGGYNVLKIKGGFASIAAADCPDKLCVHQKKISKQGETLVCLPHKTIVSVISQKKATLDGVAR